jgi:hypothetical protein
MRKTFRLILLAIAILAAVLIVVDRANTRRNIEVQRSAAEQEAATIARARAMEDKARRTLAEHRDGQHCLDPRTGALPGIYVFVKDRLSDPASFVPLASEITPANPHGEHLLKLTYRANRPSGGTYERSETFVVQNADCSFER